MPTVYTLLYWGFPSTSPTGYTISVEMQVKTQSPPPASPIGYSMCPLFPLVDASAGVAVKYPGCHTLVVGLAKVMGL